jgi:hypothetical protein
LTCTATVVRLDCALIPDVKTVIIANKRIDVVSFIIFPLFWLYIRPFLELLTAPILQTARPSAKKSKKMY